MDDDGIWLRDAWITWWIAATSGSALRPLSLYRWGRHIIDAYAGPDRRYHGVGHLCAVLADLQAVRDQCDDALAVELALWAHDVVYDPTRSDNERRSAIIAREVADVVGWSAHRAERTAELVLATRHDAVAVSGDAAWVVDIDRGVLGAEPPAFLAYDQGIRSEYAHVPEADFRSGRARILHGFLDRDRIFTTAWWYERREEAARANLARTLARLRADATVEVSA